jgi:hypothetical protein
VSTKQARAWGIVAVLAVLLWTAGSAAGRPAAGQTPGDGETSVAAVVTPLLQYQGRLSDPGTGDPVADGVYEISLRLYNVESGGTPLWTETEDVSVQGGLFSTVLGDTTVLNLALFNGRALWLGIKVGADPEATPRQPLLPVAYALSLVPGAVMETNSSGHTLQVNNTGSGRALHVDGSTLLEGDLEVGGSAAVAGDVDVAGSLIGGSHTHGGGDISSGLVAEPRIDPALARDIEVASAIEGHRADSDAHHPRYADDEAWSAVLARDGVGSGLNADLLDNLNASAFATAGHTHWGASWTGAGTGLSLSGGATGLNAEGDDYGLYGSSSTGQGVYGRSEGGAGVWGQSGSNIGVYGASDNSYGVAGVGNSKSGVYGTSANGYGVQGYSTNGYAGYFSGAGDHNDLALGGSVGRITSSPTDQNSDLILSSNNDIQMRLDNDSGENGVLRVKNSGGTDVVTVDESGNLSVSGSLMGGTHSHSGLLLRTTSLNVSCPSSKSVGTSWTKIMDVGSFSKLDSGSKLEVTFNGRIYVGSFGSGATGTRFELRVDNSATTNGRARASVQVGESGGSGVPVSITGIFTGLGSGTRTVSIWAATSFGASYSVMVDPGCWSSDHIVVKEFK